MLCQGCAYGLSWTKQMFIEKPFIMSSLAMLTQKCDKRIKKNQYTNGTYFCKRAVKSEKYSSSIQLNSRRVFDRIVDEYFSDSTVRVESFYRTNDEKHALILHFS